MNPEHIATREYAARTHPGIQVSDSKQKIFLPNHLDFSSADHLAQLPLADSGVFSRFFWSAEYGLQPCESAVRIAASVALPPVALPVLSDVPGFPRESAESMAIVSCSASASEASKGSLVRRRDYFSFFDGLRVHANLDRISVLCTRSMSSETLQFSLLFVFVPPCN